LTFHGDSYPRFGLSAGGGDLKDRHHEIQQKHRHASARGYLIFDGLLGFGLNVGPAIFLLYIVALAAGIFILIGK
jgi:hypothetical protein